MKSGDGDSVVVLLVLLVALVRKVEGVDKGGSVVDEGSGASLAIVLTRAPLTTVRRRDSLVEVVRRKAVVRPIAKTSDRGQGSAEEEVHGRSKGCRIVELSSIPTSQVKWMLSRSALHLRSVQISIVAPGISEPT